MKIYLSSTFRDLQEYREKAYRQLRRLRHDVLSMEDGVAAHQRPLRQCLGDVEAADVYVGLFAWRYGYVPPDDNPERLAITELEYRHALSHDKTCLVFLLDESTPWPPQSFDSQTGEGNHGRRIQRLRKELTQRHTVMFFTNPDDLASSISASLLPLQFAEPPAHALATSAAAAAPRSGSRASRRKHYPNLWNPGDVLRVRFLDGSPRQRRLVERFVPIWTAYANLHFAFTDDTDAEIRVAFSEPGSWAYTGTAALDVDAREPTVNLGWITDASLDTEADYTILHEFGHVLGLLHEHQNPSAKIPWNTEAVRRMFQGPPNNWDEATVRQVVYTTWDPKLFPLAKPFDQESIMAYVFPAELTGPAHEMGQNVSLSQGDKEFVESLYPY
jgi:hypothetical protein